jgi:hypothetical protein
MQGYRTVIVNLILALAPLLALWGFDVPKEVLIEHVDKILAGGAVLYGLVNIVLRKLTRTPLGKSDADMIEEDVLWSGKSQQG